MRSQKVQHRAAKTGFDYPNVQMAIDDLKSELCELEQAIQQVYNNMHYSVKYEVYPHAFCDVYVHNITTCVSGLAPVPAGAKTYGDVSIWSGITITGFATVDKDTY